MIDETQMMFEHAPIYLTTMIVWASWAAGVVTAATTVVVAVFGSRTPSSMRQLSSINKIVGYASFVSAATSMLWATGDAFFQNAMMAAGQAQIAMWHVYLAHSLKFLAATCAISGFNGFLAIVMDMKTNKP